MRVHGLAVFSIMLAASTALAYPGFNPPQDLSTRYSDLEGWKDHPSYWRTIGFPDLNGDKLADTCGRGPNGMVCALSQGNTFGNATVWTDGFRDSYGWKSDEKYWGTIQFADVNGDGKADVCGRGSDGVACAISNGSSFPSHGLWTTDFRDDQGWGNDPSFWKTIQFPDVDGDGKADVCGRKSNGVYCARSNGSGFDPATLWTSGFSNDYGWGSSESYWGTFQFGDVNGDGKADACGRGILGVFCELSTGSSFTPSFSPWTQEYSDAKGWGSHPAYWQTVHFQDLNADGKADVCGRGEYGLLCALSTGTSFGLGVWWTDGFRDAYGWNIQPFYWATIQFPDLNGDGKADVCGRGAFGIHCLLSTGRNFDGDSDANGEYTDAQGWAGDNSYWQTLQFQDLNGDGRADICGRGKDGLRCALHK